jgi:branched-chain amino acid transport system ATP-binding protein
MEPILRLESVSKSFGGLRVTNDLSFSVFPGEISAIIGPNGAGKTTLFNQITGHLLPDNGKILFKGENIVGSSPQSIVKRGMGRAFQIASIFPEETVLDNVKAASLSNLNQTLKFWRSASDFKRAKDQAYAILGSLGLDKQADQLAFELSHGDQKLLDIAIALALEPTILLLDEPTAGMSPEERQRTRKMIKEIREKFDLTLVFIEHDMDMVFDIAQIVRVLQQGSLLAEGSPEEIQQNSEVVSAYLGEEL